MKEIATYEHKVQYYETDQMGVVHHSNYIRWFEEARTYILEQAGFGYDKMEELGIISPVLEDICAGLFKPDVVLIETKLVAYNGVRMTLEYTVRDKETGEVRCTGETKHCFISREGNILRLTSSFPEIDTVVAGLLSEK